MTLYIAFKAIEDGEIGLDDRVIVSNHAASEAPVKLGLRGGQKVKLRYLIRAAAVQGSNDAATAIGEHIEGSEAAFARRMNRTAEDLGMTRSTFKCPWIDRNGSVINGAGYGCTSNSFGRRVSEYFNLFSRKNASAGVKTVRHSGRRLCQVMITLWVLKQDTRASGYGGVTLSQEGPKKIVTVVFGGRSTTTRNAQMRKLRDLGFKSTCRNDAMKFFY